MRSPFRRQQSRDAFSNRYAHATHRSSRDRGGAPVPPPVVPKRIQPAAQGGGATDGRRAAVAHCADPGSTELLRLVDGTAVGCGQSPITAKHSDLFGYAGYGYEPSRSRYDWGVKLLLIDTAEGTITGFGLANPKLVANGRPSGSCWAPSRPTVHRPPAPSSPTRRGWRGDRSVLRRPGAAADPPGSHRRTPAPPLSQLAAPTGVEAIIWTLKRQLGLEHHAGRVPAGLWARVVQSLLALNTAIWHNWAIGAPVKRSLIAYDH